MGAAPVESMDSGKEATWVCFHNWPTKTNQNYTSSLESPYHLTDEYVEAVEWWCAGCWEAF